MCYLRGVEAVILTLLLQTVSGGRAGVFILLHQALCVATRCAQGSEEVSHLPVVL